MTPTALLALLDEPTARAVAEISSLPAILADGLAAARRAWPRLAVREQRFVEQVAAALDTPEAAAQLPRLPFAELYLVAACGDYDALATEQLVRAYTPSLEVALRRLSLTRTDIDDVLQKLWETLLVGVGGGRPRIADYRGRGELGGWLRASAVRVAYRVLERAGRDPTDDRIADVAEVTSGADVAYLKQRYAVEFRAAFEAAMAALSSRQRALLRRHYLDGLTGDQLGALYGGVHRTTATRWIAEARRCVLEHTQRELRERLRVCDTELQGLLHLVKSQLDLSVERCLATSGSERY